MFAQDHGDLGRHCKPWDQGHGKVTKKYPVLKHFWGLLN